ADRLRPKSWNDFQGLEKIDSRLVAQIKSGSGRPPSLLLWGPPGCGKTTLARIFGRSFSAQFVEFSAVLVGVKDIRDIASKAAKESKPTILFVDEIHRLNKGQQDAFLPHVEAGTFCLVGATTENPSFYLTNALLSRMRVISLSEHGKEALRAILSRASLQYGVELEEKGAEILCRTCSGDARRLLNLFENLCQAHNVGKPQEGNLFQLTETQVSEYLEGAGYSNYDRDGEEHYNIVSAFIKSMRGSDPDAALYYAFRMIEGGEDPRFVIRRMIIFASEDIGNAEPEALQLAVATADAYDRVGLPEAKIPIAQCITYLATAPKSNRSYVALKRAESCAKEFPNAKVPMHLRNAPTKLMKQLGYGKNYDYPHNHDEGYVAGTSYLPEEIGEVSFYEPSKHGRERPLLKHKKID
ncbi:MAG: replication-associated recombination protein A, partial [Bdellovibrionales bacterium]|nr:replication-associated recombination protein A [Bdellovibrionales bacterium]